MLIEPVIAAQLNAHQLGDKRLDKRCAQVQQQLLLGHTSQSFPQLVNQPYQLKAFYRLLNNPHLSPSAISRGYGRGLLNWARSQPLTQDCWFLYQDTTFGKYYAHSLELGYLQLPTNNGLLLHHGLLTDEQFVPLGLPIQLIIQRDPAEYGKRAERKDKPFADKESAKWLAAIDWSRRFSRQTGRTLVQVCDREADIKEVMNYSLQRRQPFIIRAHHNRHLRQSTHTLSSYESTLGEGHLVERMLLDGQGRAHACQCLIRYGRVALRDIDKPIWVLYLQQLTPIGGQELAHWMLLSSVPVEGLSGAVSVLDAYCHRWPTCEDFHKCLKSGCAIEERHLHSTQALFGAIGLLSLVAVGLQRLRHLAQQAPEQPLGELVDSESVAVADQLAPRYLTRSDESLCVPRSVLWFVLLLARLGGHQGMKQAGRPGWQTIWRGYRQFKLLLDGYNISKNEYLKQKPRTYG